MKEINMAEGHQQGGPRPGNEVVKDQEIRLDYGKFEKKSFVNCRLVYAGGQLPTLRECDFIESPIVFEGPAGNTLAFIKAIVTQPGGAAMFDFWKLNNG